MQKKITFWVVALHAAVIAFLLFSPARKIQRPVKHIAVRMTSIRPAERSVAAPIASSGPARQPAAKKTPKEKPAAKTSEKKKEAAAEPKPKIEPSKSRKPAVVEKDKRKQSKPAAVKNLVEELEEAVAKIEEKREKGYAGPKLEVPRLAMPAPVGSSFFGGVSEPSYQEILVSYLHQSLNLPEFGEVKIQLSLHKDGTVAKLTVLKAESSKNKAYLEKNLPLLKFPGLEKEETFVFTFCNEI
jgi:outer membrane biosynthesis protein TonB